MQLKEIMAGVLNVAYADHGSPEGKVAVLLHGFPYDIHAYDDVVQTLVSTGSRIIVPFLRGFGPTRFLSATTLRSGQQAALGHDLLALLDALGIDKAVLAGYDWGGRAACIVSALWPHRVRGLVTGGGYNIQDIPGALKPLPPLAEHNLWYQYYFHGERGRAGLERYRYEFCKLLWKMWSPSWSFDDEAYARTAPAFDNPDFVEIVIHSYRHRYGLVPGDPDLEASEQRLALLPPISVPSISIHGADNGVIPVASSERHHRYFSGEYERVVLPRVGHNLPQEAPQEFARAVLALA